MQERYENLKEKEQLFEDCGEHRSDTIICLDKSLSDAMADFDRLFCCECLVNPKTYPLSILVITNGIYYDTKYLVCLCFCTFYCRSLVVLCMVVLNRR